MGLNRSRGERDERSIEGQGDRSSQPGAGVAKRVEDRPSANNCRVAAARTAPAATPKAAAAPMEPCCEALVNSVAAGIISVDTGGRITFANETAAALLGRRREEMVGQPVLHFIGKTAGGTPRSKVDCPLFAAMERRASYQRSDDFFWRGDGAKFPVEYVSSPLLAAGEVVGATLTFRDISARKALEKEQARLLAILEESPEIVSTSDKDGRIIYRNRAGRELLGEVHPDPEPWRHLRSTHPPWAVQIIEEEAVPTALRQGVWRGETAVIDPQDGREIPVLQTVVAHKDSQGQLEYFSTILLDITERKNFEAKLTRLATRDHLTGLLNRTSFQKHLASVFKEPRLKNTTHALLYFDLDSFKGVNDSLGHHVGDKLLRRFAAALQENFRRTDAIARLGGDEFAVLMCCTTAEEARQKADQFLQQLQWQGMVKWAGIFRPTASVGVALYPCHGHTADELLVSADLAMYEAKHKGGNGTAVFSADLRAGKEMVSLVTWENRLREALRQNKLKLFRQPVVNFQTDQIAGYELLLRLQDDQEGLVAPGVFLPAAERAGLIKEIDLWVVSEALALLEEMARRHRPLVLSVNLSGRSLTDEEFIIAVEEKLARSTADPAYLVMEITEQAAIENINTANRHLLQLQNLGCRFALDDFGVGYACFDLLRRLPVQFVKIDGSFIRDLPASPLDQQLIKVIVQAARVLDTKTTAEFVGDGETVNLLKELGVDFGQGYYLGRPEPLPPLWG